MEKKFYTDDFENFLKDNADNFRMYPSRRVWHSIYNDLHPSRKWPSLAVCLLLIFSIMYVGITHQNDLTIPAKNDVAGITPPQFTNVVTAKGSLANVTDVSGSPVTGSPNRELLTNVDALQPVGEDQSGKLNAVRSDRNQPNQLPANISATDADDADLSDHFSATGVITRSSTTVVTAPGEVAVDDEDIASNVTETKSKTEVKENLLAEKTDDRAWIEDFAFHNKPLASVWKSKVSYQFYVTPSIGFRKLSRNTEFDPVVTPSFIAAPANAARRQDISHIPAVNMELGANISYSLSKAVNLKFGVQFNYTNYNINAYDLRHPTVTTVMLNDLNSGYPYLVSRSTSLANIDGVYNTKLNNNTYQVSLPVGADIKIAGKNNVKWYAGASIQPTYIAGGQSYLLSSDNKNYVDGNSMMRNWNLNAGVETFVSYKTKSGIILNAGPQFRYQLLSTLTNEYTYDEQLYNIGVKIGIVTKF